MERRDGVTETEKTEETTKADAKLSDKTAYLKEAMRLVELGIEEQHISKTVLERKAVLLITFCGAVIGYLITADFDSFKTLWACDKDVGKGILWVLKFLSILPLGGAVGYGMVMFVLTDFTIRGLDPQKVWNYDNYDELAKRYIKDAESKFDDTNIILDKKARRFERAYQCLFVGLFFSVVLVLIHQFIL